MLHPTYAWMFFNWYLEGWWGMDNGSCIVNGSTKAKDLEKVLQTSLVLDHLPRIEDDRADELNVGNIVSNFLMSFVVRKQTNAYEIFYSVAYK